MRRFLFFGLYLLIFHVLLNPGNVLAKNGDTLVVSPDGPIKSITDALQVALDGDRIEVKAGTYSGPIVVDKSVTLVGIGWPVIDGGGRGTVIELNAPGIVFEGFIVRNSGASLDEENSGISGIAPELTIQNNRLEETLFGIYLKDAQNSIVRGNTIHSKDLDVPRRGDPIRVWYSNYVLIENNDVTRGRDVVLWYSEHLTVRENTIQEGRYGLHFMYCDDALIEGNLLLSNSVGTFMMYSRRLRLFHNTIAYNHGPSGYGVGLKDMDDAIIVDNLFLENRIGAHLDNSPREVDSIGTFETNVFAFNDIGVNFMPSVRHNQFSGNSFVENQEHVSISGGGQILENLWTLDGEGNFWSNYAGYDVDQDGFGDEPYRAERLFENLTDRHPELRFFIFSPSAQAVDFAAQAVPFVRPEAKLTDERPLMRPIIPDNLPPLPVPKDSTLSIAGASLLILAVGFISFPLVSFINRTHSTSIPKTGENYVIKIQSLTKRYGKNSALDDVSFDIDLGEAVALWGPNGAGKTTALRCMLGLLPYEGQVTLGGLDSFHQGKSVRKLVGFVPQELTFHDDLTIHETLNFYARLKKVKIPDGADPIPLLEQMGLSVHAEKFVGELSGGMKQRLALAIAMLGDPPVLMLDEPTSNLDARAREDFLALLLELKGNGKTLIFSSHRLEEIASLADRVLLLEGGRLVADCPPFELSEHAGWNVTLRLRVGENRVEEALETLLKQGVYATPNGKGVRVKVTPGRKGFPISVLEGAGITVEDFEIEHLERS